MAKYCSNCNEKISYGSTAFSFKFSKARLCSRCKLEAMHLIHDYVIALEELSKRDFSRDEVVAVR